MYTNVNNDASNAALRARPGQASASPVVEAPAGAPASGSAETSAPSGVVVPPVDDPDASPASAPPKAKTPPLVDDSTHSIGAPVPLDPETAHDANSGSETNGEAQSRSLL